ncbi:MAG: 3-hydroxyacyl-CoA dehydrogenase family protein [Syntrophales bacterium]
MQADDVKNVSVIGAGIMGHGIAISYALGGYNVTLSDVNDEVLDKALNRIRKALETFAESALISGNMVDDTLLRIHTTSHLETAAQEADIVVEAVSEKLDLKRKLFARLDLLCPERTILASNTSSLLIGDIGVEVKRKDKILITHYFNPAHIVPVVEIARGVETSDETVDLLHGLLKKLKKVPIRINKEIPGLLINRIQNAIRREVWSLLEQGVASAEDIDDAVKGTFGFRLASIGPLLTYDLAGLDTACQVSRNLFPVICDSHEVPLFIKKKVEEGALGRKSGKGIFDYSEEEWQEKVKQRDKEFLERLKCLYWSKKD